MSNDRGSFQPSHTWGLSARTKSQIRLGIRKALLSAVLTVAVVAPVRARVQQAAGRQVGVARAQATAALQQMQVATAKQAEAVVALQQKQAQEAAVRQAQEEAARQAQALALLQQQAEAAAQQQAQAAAQQQAEAAALQQRQAQEAAAKQAQAAAQRQAQAAAQGQQFVQPPAGSQSAIERSILNTVNQQRAAAGLSALQLDPTLTATARAHSAQMSDGNRLFHTTDLSAGAPPKWRTLGENVAMSTSLDSVNARFMESPTHRANILGNFDRVGIGVTVAGGRIWVTQEFMQTS
jgi:uncharacterized protein YkwD